MQEKALYPGSFDPITFGHIDIIERLSRLFPEIVVLIANAPHKNYLFSAKERAQLVRDCLKKINNVKVEIHDGLTVDYAKKHKSSVIIRGLRAVSDFEYEMAMANSNRHLNEDVETMIVFARPELSYISSRMVKEVAMFGGNIKELVPQPVVKAMQLKIKGKK